MARELAVAIAGCQPAEVAGEFLRHSSVRWKPLTGSNAGGRWGRVGTYPVLYVGRPLDSVIVEAYRHLVDDVDGMRAELVQPRHLIVCRVRCTNILDLCVEENQRRLSLPSEMFTSAVDDYEACLQVASVAHQLGWHGIKAPSASGLGETLALFEERLPAEEFPVQIGEPVLWDGLPADPRRPRLRLIEDSGS